MHIRVEGVRWTRFWWYSPANGWPTGETDILGGKYMCIYIAIATLVYCNLLLHLIRPKLISQTFQWEDSLLNFLRGS